MSHPALRESQAPDTRVLFATGFRPFFLLAGIHGWAFLTFWLAILVGWLPAPAWLVPTWWHGHEMLFGFAGAAIAGFLLTAVPVWTGSRRLGGAGLAALAALWLTGRLAMMGAGMLPPIVPAVLDLAFLPAVASVLAPALLAARRARNYGFVPILLGLFAANAMMHSQALGLPGARADLGVRLALDLVLLLLVVVGGRIVPTFTGNALRRAGVDAEVRARRWVEILTVPVVLGVVVSDLLLPRSPASGIIALLAAGVLLARMAGWQSFRTMGDSLVWSLHLGYVWIPVGLACLGLSDLTGLVPRSSGLHALATGAFGTMILTVMSRVSLGHTGRELVAPPRITAAYALITIAALMRTVGPVVLPEDPLPVLAASGLLFAAAFALFTAVYAPVLTSPRVDGVPG